MIPLRDKIVEYIKPEYKILNVGNVISKFTEDLFYEGIKNATNNDFSEKFVRFLKELFEE